MARGIIYSSRWIEFLFRLLLPAKERITVGEGYAHLPQIRFSEWTGFSRSLSER